MSRKRFTLIELLIVVAIIAILFAILLPFFKLNVFPNLFRDLI